MKITPFQVSTIGLLTIASAAYTKHLSKSQTDPEVLKKLDMQSKNLWTFAAFLSGMAMGIFITEKQ